MLKIFASGNLTAAPSIRTSNNGTDYVILRIASVRRYKDRYGDRVTDFVSIKVCGPLADRCAAYLKKSDRIAAYGELETIVTDETNTGFLIKAHDIEFPVPRKKEEELPLDAELTLPEGIEELLEGTEE